MECHIPGPWRDSSFFSGFFRKAWSPDKKASLKSSWRTDFPKRTDWLWFCETEMFTEDTWERILRRSQLCVWFISWNFQVNHSSAPGWSFFCVCVRVRTCTQIFFFKLLFGWTFAANGTCPAERWPWGSPSFFVNLNKKRGKGKSLRLDPQPQLHPLARKGH